MKTKRASNHRVFKVFMVISIALILALLGLLVSLNYLQYLHERTFSSVAFEDELGTTIPVSRSMVETFVSRTRFQIEKELESIESSKQGSVTEHVIDRTKWIETKDVLEKLRDSEKISRFDQLYRDIESALADIDSIL
ncbi:MAG: hypothetical protein F4Z01_09265 [Gammaproteobacteria bacterium]|nr:hypothetical protein [Gammaproteobacteria bacterium]MYF38989.1 hypothetical protein [Gammaproteobacteria bacterium]